MGPQPRKEARHSSPRQSAGPGITPKDKINLVPKTGEGTKTPEGTDPEAPQRTPSEVLRARWHDEPTVPIVEIHWVDAVSTGDDWVDEGTLDTKPAPSLAVGYLVAESEVAVTIVALVNEVHTANGITIPRGCIIEIRPLEGSA